MSLPPLTAEQRAEALRRALRGDFDHLTTEPTSGPVFGLLFALKELADQFGLTAALGKTRLAKLARDLLDTVAPPALH